MSVHGLSHRLKDSSRSENPLDLDLIAESIPHIVWLSRPDGSVEYVNRQGTDYLGLPPEALYGWNWTTLVDPDDAEAALVEWERAIRSQTPFQLAYRFRRFDGEFRWHDFRGLPVRDEQGTVTAWGTATDIEDAKQATP